MNKLNGPEKRITLEEAIISLGTDRDGINILTRHKYISPADSRILAEVRRLSSVYEGLNLDAIMEEAKAFVRKTFPAARLNLTVPESDILNIKGHLMGYDSALKEIMGFETTSDEIASHNGGLITAIEKTLKPIKIGEQQLYLARVVRAAKDEAVKLPKYHEAIADILTSRVAADVLDSLRGNRAVDEFCREFGIDERKLNDYLKRGILKKGTANLVAEVCRFVQERYKIVLNPDRVKPACSRNRLLQEATRYESIANRDDFVKQLVPVDDIASELYNGFIWILQMAKDHLTANYQGLPVVINEGKLFLHSTDKAELIRNLVNMPIRTRKKYIMVELSCEESHLDRFSEKFSCLRSSSLLNKEGVAMLISELDLFRRDLYDGDRLMGFFYHTPSDRCRTQGYVPSSALLRKVMKQAAGTERFFGNKIYEDDAFLILEGIDRVVSDFRTRPQDAFRFVDLDYVVLSPNKTMLVDSDRIQSDSVAEGDMKAFGKKAYTALQEKVFLFNGKNRYFLDDIGLVIGLSPDVTVHGLCFQIDPRNYKRITGEIRYVIEQLEIKLDKSLDPDDTNKYLVKSDAERVKQTIEYLQSRHLGLSSGSFIDRAVLTNPTRSYYSRKEAKELLGTSSLPKPTIEGQFELYSATDLAEYVKRRLPIDFVNAIEDPSIECTPYELLYISAKNSPLISQKGFVVDEQKREESIKRLLKLSDHIYKNVRKNANRIMAAYNNQTKITLS